MIRLTDRPDMTLDVYHGRKTTQQCSRWDGDGNYLGMIYLVSP